MNHHSPLTDALSDKLKMKLRLVQAKLELAHAEGRTEFTRPLDFIAHHRRVDDTQAVPVPFRLIAIELSDLTQIDTTHETVRRWYRAAERQLAAQ